MHAQGQSLLKMVGAAVAGLGQLDTLVPVLESLGRRHASYGVQSPHYDCVGKALLWTLQQGRTAGCMCV